MSRNFSNRLKSFSRPVMGPDGGVVSLNEGLSIALLQDRAVVIKQGARLLAYYEGWTLEQLLYIRDEFVRVMLDPENAPDPDWSLLAA